MNVITYRIKFYILSYVKKHLKYNSKLRDKIVHSLYRLICNNPDKVRIDD